MFYIACCTYSPNVASCIRVMAYAKAVSESGVKAKIVFFCPDENFSQYEGKMDNVVFIYLWKQHYINFPILNKLSLRFVLYRFVKKLNKSDVVYVYSFPDLFVELSRRKDIYKYIERTEHDDVYFKGLIKPVSLPSFLRSCRSADGVMVISQGLRHYYIEKGCDPEKVHIINMIVDNSRFEGLQKQDTEPYIAYCGSASNTKDGVDQLIKAFSFVVKHHPEYKLYIIGPKPSNESLFGNLELARQLDIEKNVVFTGVVHNNEMPQLLKDARILALDRPDNMQAKYGFPTKLGEYLLTENPVVITSVGDIPLFLQDGESALIASPNKPEEFAEKICWAIDHPIEAKIIGTNGKIVAEKNFNYLTETQKILRITKQL